MSQPKQPQFEQDYDLAVKDEEKVSIPKKYAVMLHNDDYTTMEFVIEVLQKFFKKTGAEAEQIMMKVHYEGRGVAGVYSREIAETKAHQTVEYARAHEFPLLATAEAIE